MDELDLARCWSDGYAGLIALLSFMYVRKLPQ